MSSCRIALALLTLALPARAADLSVGIGSFPLSVDPQFYNGIADKGLAEHLFTRLVEQKGDLSIEPGLAAQWHAVSDTIWEFTLRQDVTWSDGVPLTADDVAFSLARAPNVPNSPLGYAPMLRSVKRVEVTGPHTLRIETLAPAPNLPLDLANIWIVAKHVADGAGSADFNSGRAAVGTGPYRLVRFAINDRVELERNPAWRGPAPVWERVNIRFIPQTASRTAALLAGDVDVIDAPSESDLPRLQSDPRVHVASVLGNRSIFFLPDMREGSSPFVFDAAGKPLPRNPLHDVRVRQALSIAINRSALTERVLAGTSQPMGQFMWPGAYSYAPGIAVPPYDPDGARRLLTEAGYPQGFRLTLHTYGDRPGFVAAGQAVAQMWSRIGVQTAVEAVPTSMFLGRGAKHEYSMPVFSWGISTGEVGYALTNVFERKGPANWGDYNNPEYEAVTDRALSTMDEAARERMLIEAMTMLVHDVAFIPQYQLINFWASRKGVVYAPRVDQRTVAMSAQPEG